VFRSRETEELVTERSTEAYRQIAALLADLRETLAGSQLSGLADHQARKPKDKNPTRFRGFPHQLRTLGLGDQSHGSSRITM
jgi:hypothetical protein